MSIRDGQRSETIDLDGCAGQNGIFCVLTGAPLSIPDMFFLFSLRCLKNEDVVL